jgi:hypothetical protein
VRTDEVGSGGADLSRGLGLLASRVVVVPVGTGWARPNPACRDGGPNTARPSGQPDPSTIENGSGRVGTKPKSCRISGLTGGPYPVWTSITTSKQFDFLFLSNSVSFTSP